MDGDETCDKVVQLNSLVIDHGGAVQLEVLQWRRGNQRGYILGPRRVPKDVDRDRQRSQLV